MGAGIQPWDGKAMGERLKDLVVALPRTRFDLMDPPDDPGIYLHFLAHRDLPLLGPLSAGVYPLYVGSATSSLRERQARYAVTLKGVEAFELSDLYVALLPVDRTSSALFAEQELLAWLRPLLNGWGFGSKDQGARRSTQRCSAFDALFPGRTWAPSATAAQRASAALAVTSYLAGLDPEGPRWPPLRGRASWGGDPSRPRSSPRPDVHPGRGGRLRSST
ncbi:MAG: Eco29kI family restriction endonuclease [Actinomycetota bacterium]|jgi:hypothetical protein|nr:Eco29kI family restriction endonuclease [Actinomycetota bacterium]MDA8289580.1 Eco29kI family restriction endonuclease [Actinomycetota bacterium]